MEKSSFFNSEIINGEYDRVYLAEDYARYFSSFVGNGVFPNPSSNLRVSAEGNSMKIIVAAGKAWINGYYYENDSDLLVSLDPADGVLHRIDRIVLRLDFLEREISIKVKKGTFSSSPVAAALERSVDAYELAIADVRINNGIISIVNSSINDLRLNKNLCGLAHGIIEQVDTTEIFNTYQEYLNEKLTGGEFTEWFNGLKEKLNPYEDAALQLQVQIEGLENKFTTIEGSIGDIEKSIGAIEESVGENLSEQLGGKADKNGSLQTNLNADMIDGVHADRLAKYYKASNSVNIADTNLKEFYGTCVTQNSSAPNTDWWHIMNIPHSDSNGYGGQLAIGYHGNAHAYVRSASGTSWGAWSKILTQADKDELFQYANNGKNAIANAIVGVGGSANNSMSFQQLADAVKTCNKNKFVYSSTVAGSISFGVAIDENGCVYSLEKGTSYGSNTFLKKYDSNMNLQASLEFPSTSSSLSLTSSFVKFDRFINKIYVYLNTGTGTGWYNLDLSYYGAVYGANRKLSVVSSSEVNWLDQLTGDVYRVNKSNTTATVRKIDVNGNLVYQTTVGGAWYASNSNMSCIGLSKNMIFIEDKYSNGSYVTICNKSDGTLSKRVRTNSGNFWGGFTGDGTLDFSIVTVSCTSSSIRGNQKCLDDGTLTTFGSSGGYFLHCAYGIDGTTYVTSCNSDEEIVYGLIPYKPNETALDKNKSVPINPQADDWVAWAGPAINTKNEIAFVTSHKKVAKYKI